MANPGKSTAQMRRTNAMVENRRKVLVGALSSALILSLTTMGHAAASSVKTLEIGYVSPQTGPLAGFGEVDKYEVAQMTTYFKAHPISIGGAQYNVNVTLKDAPTSAAAAAAAQDLINNKNVDLILASSTPDIVNPVADQCEANAVPCITTVAPWQAYFLGRQKNPAKPVPFKWTYHFFWGLEDVISTYQNIWSQIPNNSKAGTIWPNDPDGQAWSGDHGFPPALAALKFTTTNPGLYADGNQDFTSQISAFKKAKDDVLLGVPIPPDFTTFWNQAVQQGYHPKVATIGKALLFPSSVEALGTNGQNLSTEMWWGPTFPFTSSLTGQSAAQLVSAYESATKKQWSQPLGFSHALFEVMAAAFKAAGTTDKTKVAKALSKLKVNTIVGSLDWTKGPVPNVAKTPLAGAQWRAGINGHKYDLVVVSNVAGKMIPVAGKAQALTYK